MTKLLEDNSIAAENSFNEVSGEGPYIFFRVVVPGSCPCFSGWPYPHVYMVSSNWTQGLPKNEGMKLGEECWGSWKSWKLGLGIDMTK